MYAATLLVDASWCPKTGAAGYGYWIASDRGKLGGGNPLKGKIKSSNVAEMQAVCNSLYILKAISFLLPGERVLIQTDSQAAIMAFKAQREISQEDEQFAVKVFRRLAKDIEVNFRHVKGHSGRREPRYLANKHCDKYAKRGMTLARHILTTEEKHADI